MPLLGPIASAMKATVDPSALIDAAPALASCDTSFEVLAARSRMTMSGIPFVFDPAATVSSAWVVKATLLPAALMVDSRLGAFPDDVLPLLTLASTVEGDPAGLLRT